MEPLQPVLALKLFPPLSQELITLLRSLAYDDWDRPTVCEGWSVKDITAHLLGGNLGRLGDKNEKSSRAEDAAPTFEELVSLIDRSNAEWVRAARRIGRKVLIEFLDQTDQQLYQVFKMLPLNERASVSVSWAGEIQSPNWFDIAREYTEKWLHQQHIREAVGQPVLDGRQWLYPVLDTFMRALPYTYRFINAAEGTLISFMLVGEAGGDWSLLRQNGKWRLFSGASAKANSFVSMDQDTAWRLFTRGIDADAAFPRVQIEGNQELGSGILHLVSIMA